MPYRSVLEWAYHQELAELTNVDVAANWHEHHSEQTGTDNENTLKDAAVCFFNICQGALLGKLVIGRRGQPTRLQISTSELESFIESGPSALPNPSEEVKESLATLPDPATSEKNLDGTASGTEATLPSVQPRVRIFISHGKNMISR